MSAKPHDALNPKYDGPWKKPAGVAWREAGERGLWPTKAEKKAHQEEIKEKRKAVGYEVNAPRCDICAHFQPKRRTMVNSLPVEYPARCRLHEFRVDPTACCDAWKGKDGSVLDAPKDAG